MPPLGSEDYSYIPILGVRPAEMQGLEELSPAGKSRILPYIVLQPWVAAKQIESVYAKVEAAAGDRPIVVDLTDDIFDETKRRPVHDAFDKLRDSTDGFKNWLSLVDGNQNYIPTLQLSDPNQIAKQLATMAGIGRGVVIRLHENTFNFAADIAKLVSKAGLEDNSLFILDFQRQNKDILLKTLQAVQVSKAIRANAPHSKFSVSASTFPESFVGLKEQEIFERRFYKSVTDSIGSENTVYCDRGSVRAERQDGGSGSPAPRIDNALSAKWQFFREPDEDDRDVAYQIAASNAVSSPEWEDLGIWGTEIIKRTAAGEDNAVGSAKMSTAARINIHLYRQAGAMPPAVETDWAD